VALRKIEVKLMTAVSADSSGYVVMDFADPYCDNRKGATAVHHEIVGVGSRNLDDLGIRSPGYPGLWIFEGSLIYHLYGDEVDVQWKGTYRRPTTEEYDTFIGKNHYEHRDAKIHVG